MSHEMSQQRTLPSGTNPRLVTVRPDADLGDVLSKMALNHVHHVFVTDLESRPIGEERPLVPNGQSRRGNSVSTNSSIVSPSSMPEPHINESRARTTDPPL